MFRSLSFSLFEKASQRVPLIFEKINRLATYIKSRGFYQTANYWKRIFPVQFIWQTNPTAEKISKIWFKMIYGFSGLEKSLLSYGPSVLIRLVWECSLGSFEILDLCNDWSSQCGSKVFLIQSYEFFSRGTSAFWMKANHFLKFPRQ